MILRALLLVLLLIGAAAALGAAQPAPADPTIRTADQPLSDPGHPRCPIRERVR